MDARRISLDYVDVLKQILDSDNTTVGGGSSSALVGAMACGLIGMVCKLSTKKDYGLSAEKQLEYAKELEGIKEKLLEGAVKDVEAYTTIVNAYKLPKDTDEEKEARNKAISDAGVVGATTPMNNARLCRRVYEIGMELDGKSNPNCHSDLVIGYELARNGVRGGIMNIEANLPIVKDEGKVEEFNNAIRDLSIG